MISGEEHLTTYQFNTKVAKHVFCNICGVQAYYRPRSNPDGFAITLACIDQHDLNTYEICQFIGKEWENFYKISNIQKFSKS